MKLQREAKLWKIGVALVSAILLVSAVISFLTGRRPDKYLIPRGYTGYLIIEHGIKGAPVAPIKNGFNVYRFPASGRVKTSAPIPTGFASDEYDYITPHGLVEIPDGPGPGEKTGPGIMIWAAKSTFHMEGFPECEYAFVGTQSQYEAADRGPSPESEEAELSDKAEEQQVKSNEAHQQAIGKAK